MIKNKKFLLSELIKIWFVILEDDFTEEFDCDDCLRLEISY